MTRIIPAGRAATHLSVVPDAPGLRLIAYLWFPREPHPRREVIHVSALDEGRAVIRRMFKAHGEALGAELWDEDRLIARLRPAPVE